MIISIDYEPWKPETYKGVEVWSGQFLVVKIYTGRVEEDLEDAEQYAACYGKDIHYSISVDSFITETIQKVVKDNAQLPNL